jgi:hypothetical protein
VIALPPVVAGAVKETAADVVPGMAVTDVGALATPIGVTEDEAAEATLVPAALVAVAVKV